MSQPYQEGSLFAIPLRDSGFAVGVVARASAAGKVILCYFFGPCRTEIPDEATIASVRPAEAVLVVRVGDLSLQNGTWPIVGRIAPWRRSEWPFPAFIRREGLSLNAWKVQYSDEDPTRVLREIPVPFDTNLERDAVYGAGAAELVLTRLLRTRT